MHEATAGEKMTDKLDCLIMNVFFPDDIAVSGIISLPK